MEFIDIMRHSVAHIMAAAVEHLYSSVLLDIGTSISNGFYYDFDLKHKIIPDNFIKIESVMNKIISANIPFERIILTRDEAIKFFSDKKQYYKVQRIYNIALDENIILYKMNKFIDLCKGPHIKHTGQVGAMKLLSVAGSYYQGNEKNKMLQRIYGIAFETEKQLDEYTEKRNRLKYCDHRKLGKKLDLFSISKNIGSGLILWHQRGVAIRSIIEDYWKSKHYENMYELVSTPHIGKANLWNISNHLSFYKENMYPAINIGADKFYVKPMNCPFHIEIYKSNLHSYRELPIRYAELGTVYRNEKSGVIHGLLRAKGFTQDDAHIICTPEQIENEILKTLKFSLSMLKKFGFNNIKAYLATRPKKYIGSDEKWKYMTQFLQAAVKHCNLKYETDLEGGIFYGPKIDLKICDSFGREWQMSTIQIDFNLPDCFDMVYVDKSSKKVRPYMLHRALFGSIERFIGLLLEHYEGDLPLWLSPEQILILPVSEKYFFFANIIKNKIFDSKIKRIKIDIRSKTLESKIRDALMLKIPYIIVVGEKEEQGNFISVRHYSNKKIIKFNLDEFIEKLINEIKFSDK